MKIIYLGAYFYPEKFASEQIYASILKQLAKTNEVHVIAPQPTRGVTDEEYVNFKEEEVVDGVIIHRFRMYRESASTLKRFIRYKKCDKHYKRLSKKIGKADFVFATSTPPTMGLLAGKIAKKMGAKFVYSIQDMFPESLVSSGVLKQPKGLIWRLGKKIKRKTYKLVDNFCVISKNFYNSLLADGVQERKITFIPNWIDVEQVGPIEKVNNRLYEEFSIDRRKFNVLYAGNLGYAQGAEIILDVAEKLQHKNEVQFIIFGGGSGYQSFAQGICAKNLSNVILNPLLPKERLSEVYSLGDVSLIICKKGVGETALPSKTWSIMACNTPIIASFDLDSELVQIIKEVNAGVCVQPNDAEALSSAIMDLVKKPISVCSRQYIQENLSKDCLVEKYMGLFK